MNLWLVLTRLLLLKVCSANFDLGFDFGPTVKFLRGYPFFEMLQDVDFKLFSTEVDDGFDQIDNDVALP